MQTSAIVQRFREAASRYPDRPAIIGTDFSISYSELERRAASVAQRIAERVPGPTVALLHSNSPHFAPLFLGARLGGQNGGLAAHPGAAAAAQTHGHGGRGRTGHRQP